MSSLWHQSLSRKTAAFAGTTRVACGWLPTPGRRWKLERRSLARLRYKLQIEVAPPFDFEQHERAAVAEYLKCQPFYADLASVVSRILEECLKKDYIKVHSVQYR